MTDGQTDRPTKLGTEAPSPELKKKIRSEYNFNAKFSRISL